MTPDRIRVKADALATAWRHRFGAQPSLHTVALALCPAMIETHCGDSWPGPDGLLDTPDDERNWGACTLRPLNATELAVLAAAGIHPTVGAGHEDIARRAQQALVDAGLPIPQGVIHCDSTTDANGQHPYFVWFAAFPDDVAGADYYLRVLAGSAEKPKSAKAVLERDMSTPLDVAGAMYSQSYFWGFHPHDHGGPGDKANVAAYAANTGAVLPGIQAALAGWAPPDDPLPPAPHPDIDPDVDPARIASVQIAVDWRDDVDAERKADELAEDLADTDPAPPPHEDPA